MQPSDIHSWLKVRQGTLPDNVASREVDTDIEKYILGRAKSDDLNFGNNLGKILKSIESDIDQKLGEIETILSSI